MDFNMADFDRYKEDNRREVKKAKGGLPNSLWETYSSFSNCYGGVIILGVSERKDGSWHRTGLTDERKLQKEFWDTINNKQKVSLNTLTERNVKIYPDEESGEVIMVIEVPPAKREQKPIYINNDIMNGSFRRNWEGDYRCSLSEVRAMLRDEPEATMDMKVLDNVPISYISKESVEGYRNRHTAYRPGHPWVKLPYEEYLDQIGAAAISEVDGQLHPTAAGLLMFGEEYHIVREFPEYFLDYREMMDPAMRWTDRLQSSSGEWSGNLFDFFFTVYNKLLKVVKVPFKMDDMGGRIDDTPVHKALREALANCLVNTDFYLPRSVVIKLYPDRIIMENPGSIRTGKKQMLKGGISDPRNKALMKMFNLISIGEHAGSGVPDIYSVWQAEGWEDPQVEEQYDPDRTILTLSLEKKQAIKTSDKKQATKSSDKVSNSKTKAHQEKIRAYLLEHGASKTADIAVEIGLSVARVRAIIGGMDEVTIHGNNKNRTYSLKK